MTLGCKSSFTIVGKWEVNCVDIIDGKPFKLEYLFYDDNNGKVIKLYNGKEEEFTYRVELFEGKEDEGAIFITTRKVIGELELNNTQVIAFKKEDGFLVTPGIEPNLEKVE